MNLFLSTPSARRATRSGQYADLDVMISIHALREEGDLLQSIQPPEVRDFYPRPPRGGRQQPKRSAAEDYNISIHALREEGDYPPRRKADDTEHFYPRPPRGGRRVSQCPHCKGFHISIHALREEGDVCAVCAVIVDKISIHALREEGDQGPARWFEALSYFYPRPPRGGRHHGPEGANSPDQDFYPRPPRGGRRRYGRPESGIRRISIHALREEGDDVWYMRRQIAQIFLSTPSARRATSFSKTCEPL